jgi:hypothetical protein
MSYTDHLYTERSQVNLTTDALKLELIDTSYVFSAAHTAAQVLAHAITDAAWPNSGVALTSVSSANGSLSASPALQTYVDGGVTGVQVGGFLIYAPGIGAVGIRVPSGPITYQNAEIQWPVGSLLKLLTNNIRKASIGIGIKI